MSTATVPSAGYSSSTTGTPGGAAPQQPCRSGHGSWRFGADKLSVVEQLSEDIDSVPRAIDVVGVAPSDQVFLRCRQLGAEYVRFRELALPSWAFGVALTAGGVGGFVGAMIAPRVGVRLGAGKAILLGC